MLLARCCGGVWNPFSVTWFPNDTRFPCHCLAAQTAGGGLQEYECGKSRGQEGIRRSNYGRPSKREDYSATEECHHFRGDGAGNRSLRSLRDLGPGVASLHRGHGTALYRLPHDGDRWCIDFDRPGVRGDSFPCHEPSGGLLSGERRCRARCCHRCSGSGCSDVCSGSGCSICPDGCSWRDGWSICPGGCSGSGCSGCPGGRS